jgi:transposase
MAVVQAQAGQPPPNFGYLPGYWTIALLMMHLADRFRIKVSFSTLRRALHRAEFRWKRPKLAPAVVRTLWQPKNGPNWSRL